MKIHEITLGAGIERRFRGPRKPWPIHIDFHDLEDLLKNSTKDKKKLGRRLDKILRGPHKNPTGDLKKSIGDIIDHDPHVLTEGGAMPGVGPIHISEIEPTLRKLESDLGVDLRNNALGSVGKKTFSGDIDVALEMADEDIPEFIKRVQMSDIVDEAKQSILVVISRVEIQNYNPELQTDKPRTGYVQVDFMIDKDPNWLKTFYHSPHQDDSKYKGAHRNITVGALSQYVDRVESDEKTEDGRPLWVERYMFSSKKGLVRIKRTPVPKKNGQGYTKQYKNEIIDGPWKTGDEIAQKLNLDDAKNLDSFETVFAAIEKNHGSQIASAVAKSLAKDKSIQAFGIPSELDSYLK